MGSLSQQSQQQQGFGFGNGFGNGFGFGNRFGNNKPILGFGSQQQQQIDDNEGDNLPICTGLNLTKSRGIEELIIGKGLYNDNCFDISKMKVNLSEFKRLKRIQIGNKCFKHVREFVIDGLESMESVIIGEECFRINDGTKWSHERDDGVCRITNCPNLRQLEIGDWSFVDFKSFELSNLNSIQSIIFGGRCFVFADFSLKGEWK